MDADIHAKLRAPFPNEAVGKLPKVTCKACSDNKREKHCDRHERKQCAKCKNWITTAHVDLDYVGHAAITDRLLQVDPLWTWEPMALDQNGLPAVDRNGGLWIRLTVSGVTRLGYGDAAGKDGANAVKEAIGDGLRNAAMRFGVALDLWHKDGDLPQEDTATPATSQAAPPQQCQNGQQRPPESAAEPERPAVSARQARADLANTCGENKWDLGIVADRFKAQYEQELGEATDAVRITAFTKLLFAVSDLDLRAPAAANGATR